MSAVSVRGMWQSNTVQSLLVIADKLLKHILTPK